MIYKIIYGEKMKQFVYYVIAIIVIIVLIPLLIVRGCSYTEEEPELEKKAEGVKIRLYISSDKKVQEMNLEEYIKGVVAAEMPANFELEALKAQAVAARTYAYARVKKIYTPKDDSHNGCDICTDHNHCQAWISRQDAMRKWGIFNANSNWKKIDRAVMETADIVIIHDKKIVNPVFHSCSGGKTENSEDVWEGVGVSYLRSVSSAGEEVAPNYICTVPISKQDFAEAIKKEYPDIKFNKENIIDDIKVLDFTGGGRVKTIRVGDVEMKGMDLRRILSLRSANFTIEEADKDSIKITTTGYGHGVGMSQWGANHLAKIGGSFEEIIKYYYTGVELSTISEYSVSN